MLTEIPHGLGYEKSVLSTLLKDPETYVPRINAEGITSEHFYVPAHKVIFGQILDLPPEQCELVAFADELKRKGQLESVGGPAGITDIWTYAPNAAHFGNHIVRLREYLARRKAILAANEIVELPLEADATEVSNLLRKASESVSETLQAKSRLWTAKAAVKALRDQMRIATESETGTIGAPTGLDSIDLVTGGLAPGAMWVVAAETSCGKSVFLFQVAAHFLATGKRVFVCSLELQKEQVTARLGCVHSGAPFQTFTRPKYAASIHVEKAKRALLDVAGWSLTIDDEGGRTMAEIAGLAELARDTMGGLDLVVIDYIQRVRGQRGRNDNREQEVASISSGMKSLAMRMQVPVLTASQLNENGKVRESRAISQDCDVLLRITEDGIVGDKVRNAVRDQLFKLHLDGEHQRFQP